MRKLKTRVLITLIGIIGFGYLSVYGNLYAYIQTALILLLTLYYLPLFLYKYNTSRRSKKVFNN